MNYNFQNSVSANISVGEHDNNSPLTSSEQEHGPNPNVYFYHLRSGVNEEVLRSVPELININDQYGFMVVEDQLGQALCIDMLVGLLHVQRDIVPDQLWLDLQPNDFTSLPPVNVLDSTRIALAVILNQLNRIMEWNLDLELNIDGLWQYTTDHEEILLNGIRLNGPKKKAQQYTYDAQNVRTISEKFTYQQFSEALEGLQPSTYAEGKFEIKNSSFNVTDGTHTIKFWSSTDGLCGLNALLFMTKYISDYDSVASVYQAKYPDGISERDFQNLCNQLLVPCHPVDYFYEQFGNINISNITSSSAEKRLESIALWDVQGREGHVYVVYDPRSRTNKLIRDSADIEKALLNPSPSQPQPLLMQKKKKHKKIEENKQTMHKRYRVHFSNEYMQQLKPHQIEDNCRCSQEAARKSILKQMGNDVDYEPVCYAGAVYWAWAFKKTNKHLWETYQLEEPAIIEQVYQLKSDVKLNGQLKNVEQVALKQCGEELIAALHCDNIPLNLSRIQLNTSSDNFDVIGQEVHSRIRGQCLPKSAYKYFSVQGIPLLQQEADKRDRLGGATTFDDIIHQECIASAAQKVTELYIASDLNVHIISPSPWLVAEALLKSVTSQIVDIMPKMSPEFASLESVWRRYMQDFRQGRLVDVMIEIDPSSQPNISQRIPPIIVQHDASAPFPQQYSPQNMGSWQSANSVEQPQYQIGRNRVTVTADFEFKDSPIKLRIIPYVGANQLYTYLCTPYERYKTIVNTLHNIWLVTQSSTISAHLTVLKSAKIPVVHCPNQITVHANNSPQLFKLSNRQVNLLGIFHIQFAPLNHVNVCIIDEPQMRFQYQMVQNVADQYVIVHRKFFNAPGVYELPFGEGTYYNIDGGKTVQLQTRKNNGLQEVPKIEGTRVIKSFSTGWHSWCVSHVSVDNAILHYEDPPGQTSNSVQSVWLWRYIEQLPKSKDLQTIMELKNKFKNFSEPNIEEELKTRIRQRMNTLEYIYQDRGERQLDEYYYLRYMKSDQYPYRVNPVSNTIKTAKSLLLALGGLAVGSFLKKITLSKTGMILGLASLASSYYYYQNVRNELQYRHTVFYTQRTDFLYIRQLYNQINVFTTVPAEFNQLGYQRLLNGRTYNTVYGYQLEHSTKDGTRIKQREYKGIDSFGQFYAVKPIQKIESTSALIDPDQQGLMRMQKMYNWVKNNPNTTVKNNELVPLDQMRTVSVFSGHHYIEGGFETKEFEWCHKNIQNQYAALFRHLDYVGQPTELDHFSDFAQKELRQIILNIQTEINEFEPASLFDYPSKAFPDEPAKQQKYIENIRTALRDHIYEKGPYKVMIKSGESQTVGDPVLYDEQGCLIHESRPRNIMIPQGIGYCLIAAVQHQIMPLLRKHIPEFIQAYSSEQLAEAFQQHGMQDPVSISLDGSGFDSTQHLVLKQAVEDPLYQGLQDIIMKIMNYSPNLSTDSKAHIHVIAAAQQHVQTLFVQTPGLQHEEWTREEKRLYKYIKQKGDYTPITLHGTTFSGDPLTTLGNTMRSIMYIKYYLRSVPSETYRLYVAGDDVSIICERQTRELIKDLILSHTGRSRSDDSALGQCVKEVIVGELEDIDFCSKWVMVDGGKVYVSRDYSKAIKERQYYTKTNSTMLNNPQKHRQAILRGLQAEQASRLLEDIIKVNCSEQELTEHEYKRYCKRRAYVEKLAYSVEAQINNKLKISYLDLFDLCQHNCLLNGKNGNKTSD